jgi:hypothetical protein
MKGEEAPRFGDLESFLSPFLKGPMRIYLIEEISYKLYCLAGKMRTFIMPYPCPFCHGCDCLVKHGWYERKGIDGDDYGYGPFMIQRLLCTTEGRTISLLPAFVHTCKRYALSFVMDCLSQNIERKVPLCAVAREHGLYVRTLKRWKQAFSSRQEAKHSCLLPGQQVASTKGFAATLLSHFRTSLGHGCLFQGAIRAMAHLWTSFTLSLY